MTADGAASARTFLIADIRGYTAYTAEHGDDAAAALARQFADIAREGVEAHEGFVIELRGDEALCAFVSARQALRAALAMKQRFSAELPRGVGIGIDSGEAIPVDGGFRGTALNLAARLCAQAKPGQIIASEAAIHLAAHVDGIAYVEPRTLKLKGYDSPVRAVDVVSQTDAPRRRTAARRRSVDRRVIAGALVAILVLAVGAVSLSGAFSPKATPAPSAPSTPAVALGSAGSSASAASPTSSASLTPVPSGDLIATEDLPLLAFLDPATGQVQQRMGAVPRQADAQFVDGAFWQLGLAPKAFYRIDPSTQEISNAIAVPLDSEGAWTVADGVIWLADNASPRVVGIDATTGSLVHDFTLSDDATTPVSGVAVGADSLWVALPYHGSILRLNPASGDVQIEIEMPTANAVNLAFGNDALWATSGGSISRIDPQTNGITSTTPLSSNNFLPFMTFSPDAVWTADDVDGTVYKVDRAGRIAGHFQTGLGARSIQYLDGQVWVANTDAGSLSAIDTDTGSITTYDLGHQIETVAAGNGAVMVGIDESPEDVFSDLPGKVLVVAMVDEILQQPAPDPATNPYPINRMVLSATCAHLLAYGDSDGAEGYVLQPEVAASMPEVSPDGLTYTFTIKPGFAFSAPSNAPITAETYRFSIERSLSGALGHDGERAIDVLSDIVGAQAFNDGSADHVVGLNADGDKLTVTLDRPSDDLLERLMLPYSCPVPIGTPAEPALDPGTPVASSGPYYLAVHSGGEYAILRRNPNYGGTRTAMFDAIALRFGLAEGQTAAWVDEGKAGMAVDDQALKGTGNIAAQWGPDSEAAASGDQRWYPVAYPVVDHLLLNPNGKLTGDPVVRRAIALALDRAAIGQSFAEVPANSVFSSSFLLRDEVVTELAGPDASAAQTQLAGRTGTIRFALQSSCDRCKDMANSLKSSLAAIGLTLEIVEVENPFDAAVDPSARIDLINNFDVVNYPDSVALLESIVGNAPDGWLEDSVAEQVESLSALTGDARRQGAARLAHDLAESALIIPFGYALDGAYFGPSVGCRTIVPGIAAVDLGALCPAAP